MAKSIIDLYTDAKLDSQITKIDETPYSIGTDKTGTKEIDDKAISELENTLGSRYGKGMGNWGATYSDTTGNKYSEKVVKDKK